MRFRFDRWWQLRHRFRVAILGVTALALTQASAQPGGDHSTVDQPVVNEPYLPFDGEFFVETLGDRCVDFGGEAYWARSGPVYTYQCNKSAAQRVRVKELGDGSHDVELRVRDLYCLGVRAPDGQVMAGRVIELQLCDGTPRQRFAIDGDAILMGEQPSGHVTREFVIEPDRHLTANRTLLVVGTREVNDAEYFRFRPVEGGERRPHSGFMTAGQEVTLNRALQLAKWGTVIELLDSQPIVLSGADSKSIPAGVTLRGYRKYTYQGPEIIRCTASSEPAFKITEEDVRVTGFRLRGPSGDRDRCAVDAPDDTSAIQVLYHTTSMPVRLPGRDGRVHTVYLDVTTVPRVLIDHLDVGYWKGSGIDVVGPNAGPEPCEPATDHCNPDDD